MKIFKEKNPVNEDIKVPFVFKLIGSGLFTGFFPIASGTAGSLLGAFIFYIPGFSEPKVMLIAILIGFTAGVFVSELMRKRYGPDPPEIVIDEIVGLWFTYLVATILFDNFFKAKSLDPTTIRPTKVAFTLIGLIVFRFFDIIKLQPARFFDDMDNGYGIMMDDVISGIYAGVITAVLTHFIWFKFLVKFFS
ncbi:MAG: phosphatidylglycerophosphatase A [Ignavibacteria bacterium]|nr:phosphatidylglycerophosphatase A [Ignavibacteria bacterium]